MRIYQTLNKYKESDIEKIKPTLQKLAGTLVEKASAKNIPLSFDASKLDEAIILYKEIRDGIKEEITKDDFLINEFKISSILSISLMRKLALKVNDDYALTKYYNAYLAYLASEFLIKSFVSVDKNYKIISFEEDFRESSIRIIDLNGNIAGRKCGGKIQRDFLFVCVLNLSEYYNLLYHTSLEKSTKTL